MGVGFGGVGVRAGKCGVGVRGGGGVGWARYAWGLVWLFRHAEKPYLADVVAMPYEGWDEKSNKVARNWG